MRGGEGVERGDEERVEKRETWKRGDRRERETERQLGNTESHFISGLPFVIMRVCSKLARRMKGERVWTVAGAREGAVEERRGVGACCAPCWHVNNVPFWI